MKLFYKLKCYKRLKEVHAVWRKHEISDVHYIGITDAILNFGDYDDISFKFALDHAKESHKRMQDYLNSIKTKS